jgi:uroporphyrin-III C-methyltransferase / precorrin-2 dehydrogenase / sirohydrochlorin ferrochelatase
LGLVANGDAAAVARLQARGLLLNVVDRPDLCDFTLPAIVDRDPVLIAIGTGGTSAGLAAAIRQRLETLLPAGLGKLAEALFGARDRLRARFPDIDMRRRAVGALLAAGGPLDPLADHADPATAIDAADAPPGRIERIEIGSADPDALTLRAARLLGQADHIHIEGMVPAPILDRARADAQRIAGAPPRVPAPGLTIHLVWKSR